MKEATIIMGPVEIPVTKSPSEWLALICVGMCNYRQNNIPGVEPYLAADIFQSICGKLLQERGQ